MSAAKLVDVTLVKAWNPGDPEGELHRIVFGMALDAQGAPDATAWLADPDPWPARREQPGLAPMGGDVAHDDESWSLRFFEGPAAGPDAPLHRICASGQWLRPGEVVTLRGPGQADAAWRVVGVG